MLAAIYARHSTDKQQGSTEDQIARCVQHCRRLGYTVVEIFCDRATSGATMMNRAGIKHLIRETLKGRFASFIRASKTSIHTDPCRLRACPRRRKSRSEYTLLAERYGARPD